MTNITIHGNTTLEKTQEMTDHLVSIIKNINISAITSINYYPDDWYAEIAINPDTFGAANDGFTAEKVITKLGTNSLSCKQKLDDFGFSVYEGDGVVFITQRKLD